MHRQARERIIELEVRKLERRQALERARAELEQRTPPAGALRPRDPRRPTRRQPPA
jgi:hypothetical protein